ncbi:MAG TPA: hypothetical protein VEU52_02475, partial [Candidatus Limnocylindrales bacterium]|nr:hypothetical protein [Candidatus Limnocylindrales bacterium]
MDEHDVLRVLGEKRGFEIERMHDLGNLSVGAQWRAVLCEFERTANRVGTSSVPQDTDREGGENIPADEEMEKTEGKVTEA